MKINKFKHNLMSEKSLQSCAECGEFPPSFWRNFRQKKSDAEASLFAVIGSFCGDWQLGEFKRRHFCA